MDKDAQMLDGMGSALVELQVKYRNASLPERMRLRASLEEILEDYAKYQIRLLKEGVITTDEDLAEMQEIQTEIDKAADEQKLLAAIAKTIAFVATKV